MSKQPVQVILSDSNRTPIIQIVVWFCLVTSFLALVTHAGIKLFVFRAVKAESGFLLVSLVFGIAQSTAVLIQCGSGLGKPAAALSSAQVQSSLKAEYAATTLLFLSLGFSKLAIVAFLYSLDPPRLRRKLNYGVGVLVCSWMLCASLVAIFQCTLPRPWDRTLKQCLDRSAWWSAIAGLNIVTELAIIAIELEIMSKLRIALKRKILMMSLFACRVLVPISAAVQLAFFHQEARNPATKEDLTLGYWRSALCNEIMQCISIITVCLPYTKIFMEGFESGLTRVDDGRRRESRALKEYRRLGHQLLGLSRSSNATHLSPDDAITASKKWYAAVRPAGPSQSHSS
ncbi:hypothetical protein B5807_10022 [Epicoccum nigrum]|uniref:Rhodopsin domain-containing protein n=1 Tax=Epicoccum nigrum TaxID=105696 RepID=A0A1Y2LTN4_EPING|nr:hypothetical protein B5807_10022 [Epicoccum nigrum]